MAKKENFEPKPKETIGEEAFKDIVIKELERVGQSGSFIWILFFLCVTPNILNGFHVSSYTLLGHLPDDQWCSIDAFKLTNWTFKQQRNIAQQNLHTHGCTILDWDYQKLSKMPYVEAFNLTASTVDNLLPPEISCKEKGSFVFEAPESTFVAEWELVCDKAIQRTSAQMFLSLGKFIGSFSFGIYADKFGRKSAFTLGAVFYVISSILCTFSPWYSLFLVGRFGLGSASSGLFYPAFTMIVENVSIKNRSWMSIAFSASYPIGMVILALAAYFVEPWRYLQLVLTVPAFLLILNCCLMTESPRWLITKTRYARAYKILFKEKSPYEILNKTPASQTAKELEENTVSCWEKLKSGPLKQFNELWQVRKLIFTSYFMFCVTSLCYYVTALNASNMAVSRYLYVAITGIVDLPSYLVPVVMLRFYGRRLTTISLFLFTGVALLMVLVVPTGNTIWIISFAMLGRFGISATYSVVTLYTAELYPTEIRNSALGTCSTWAHVGSMSAPYIVDVLGDLGWYIPTTICGCCVLVAALLTLSLPETGTKKLSDRIHEVYDVQIDEKTCKTEIK